MDLLMDLLVDLLIGPLTDLLPGSVGDRDVARGTPRRKAARQSAFAGPGV